MADSQNDMLMWLMSEAKGVERSIEGFARRLLVTNLAAIHSTSLASRVVLSSPICNLIVACQQTFIQVLYRLLAHPEYFEPLRQEVDAVIREEGWTKAGVDKMHKIDSFLRETQRVDGLGLCSLYSLSRDKNADVRRASSQSPWLVLRCAHSHFRMV